MDSLADETLKLRTRYDEEPSHSDHVAHLALEIYDGLQSWHRLDARARALMQSAALLHDIGWSQTPDGKGHHKWSAKLIRAHPWQNLDSEEIELVAQVARYHRKSPPQPDHEEFHALKPAAQKSVMILGGVLRVADALDRTHANRVSRTEVVLAADAITIRVQPTGLWDAERAMFETKRDMLQMATARPVEVVPAG